MSESNIEKLQELYAAFARSDIGMILSSVAEDVDWGVESTAGVPWYGIRHGRDGVADFFATLDREVEFTNFAPRLFAGAGDHVFVHVDIGYKMKKSGKASSNTAIHEFTLREGNLIRFRGYEDTASVREAWNG